MTKTYTACNWVGSRVIEEDLNNFVATGTLAKKENIHWRVPGEEIPPVPKDGEVIVFTNHLIRGFSPPGSKFFLMCFIFFNFTLKILDPILSPTFATSKYSVKLIFKRSPYLNYSENFTT